MLALIDVYRHFLVIHSSLNITVNTKVQYLHSVGVVSDLEIIGSLWEVVHRFYVDRPFYSRI